MEKYNKILFRFHLPSREQRPGFLQRSPLARSNLQWHFFSSAAAWSRVDQHQIIERDFEAC